MSAGTLRREAEHDDREAYHSKGSWRFSWRQVAYIALRRWTLSQIHNALGPDAAAVLPPLLALQPLTIHLPAYLVHAMEHAAAAEQTTVDDWLHMELVDFAGTVASWMESAVPGFRRAYFFPGQEQPVRPPPQNREAASSELFAIHRGCQERHESRGRRP